MDAFPDEENAAVAKLAADLLAEASKPETIHLVAEMDGRIAGHVAFSPVFARGDKDWLGYILSPLGVRPERHGRGIGSALVRSGLELLSGKRPDAVLVYGDPAFYGRFGFSAAAAERLRPPYELEHPFGWQAIVPDGADTAPDTAQLSFVAALSDPGLW